MAIALDQSPDSHLAMTLTALRGLTFDGPAADTQHLVPGVFFSLDPMSQTTVQVTSRPGMLLTMRFNVERPGRWLSLNLGVGAAGLSGCRTVSFACKSSSPVVTSFRVCLRSGLADGYRDAFFPKSVICSPDTAVHMDMLRLTGQPEIPSEAPWRELVIFFEHDALEATLHDFRLTVI